MDQGILDAEIIKDLERSKMEEVIHQESDLKCRETINTTSETKNMDWKKMLADERKRREGNWKEEEMGVLDHNQREENMVYLRKYLLYMEDRFKDDIGSVLIRKYDVDYNTFMKLGKKRRYKGILYNSEGKWRLRNKETWETY
jgi:hypothetical protein